MRQKRSIDEHVERLLPGWPREREGVVVRVPLPLPLRVVAGERVAELPLAESLGGGVGNPVVVGEGRVTRVRLVASTEQ